MLQVPQTRGIFKFFGSVHTEFVRPGKEIVTPSHRGRLCTRHPKLSIATSPHGTGATGSAAGGGWHRLGAVSVV